MDVVSENPEVLKRRRFRRGYLSVTRCVWALDASLDASIVSTRSYLVRFADAHPRERRQRVHRRAGGGRTNWGGPGSDYTDHSYGLPIAAADMSRPCGSSTRSTNVNARFSARVRVYKGVEGEYPC